MKSNFAEDFNEINDACEQTDNDNLSLEDETKLKKITHELIRLGIPVYHAPILAPNFLTYVEYNSKTGYWYNHPDCSLSLLSGLYDFMRLPQNKSKYVYQCVGNPRVYKGKK